MAKLALTLIGLLVCHFANTRTLRNDPNFQENVIQAISNISGDALKLYLENNKEAYIRIGGKLEALAEELLDKRVQSIESSLNNIFAEMKAEENSSVPTSKPPEVKSEQLEPGTTPAATSEAVLTRGAGPWSKSEPVRRLEPGPFERQNEYKYQNEYHY